MVLTFDKYRWPSDISLSQNAEQARVRASLTIPITLCKQFNVETRFSKFFMVVCFLCPFFAKPLYLAAVGSGLQNNPRHSGKQELRCIVKNTNAN